MKFGEKYELLESITTGAVETFVANDKMRGERVLVHILHGDPQKPNQPTVQWVLDSFRRVAPEPVGLVLETGRYSGTLYAYLVTKLPEETALRGWVKQYRAQTRDSQEIPAPPPPRQLRKTERLGRRGFSATPVFYPSLAAPVSVTQLLRDFDPPAKSAVRTPPPREVEPSYMPLPPTPLPPMSTEGDQSGLHSAPPWTPETPRIPGPPKTDPNAGPSRRTLSSRFRRSELSSSGHRPAIQGRPQARRVYQLFPGAIPRRRSDRDSSCNSAAGGSTKEGWGLYVRVWVGKTTAGRAAALTRNRGKRACGLIHRMVYAGDFSADVQHDRAARRRTAARER